MTVEVSERPTASHSNRAVMRQSGLTGVAAAAGVIAGLVLDISIAFRFGAGENTDAFFVASRIPLGIAAVVMAAANQALVPAFRTSLTKRGDQHTNRLISMVVCVVLAVGVLITLAAWLGAGPLIRATAPGISAQEVSLAASMVPVMFAMVPLVALAEVLRAYLNASYAFVAPALMTVVLNGLAAVVILAGPLLLGLHHKDIHLVAYAFLSGAVAQAVFMWAMAVRRGLHFQPAIDLRDKELRGIGSLSIRPLAASGLNPVARVGEQLIVSFLPTGSITILNYGYMVVSAVGGTVFFRSVIVALLPRLTDAYNREDRDDVRRFTGLGMQVMLAISLPLTAFMAVLAGPAVLGGLSSRQLQPGKRATARHGAGRVRDQPGGVGAAASAARTILCTARYAHAAANHALRRHREHGAAAAAGAAVRPPQQERDHRRGPGVLTGRLRQRRARLVSPVAL